MKQYKKLNYFLLITFIILCPILPTYGKYNSDIILYALIALNFIGFIFIRKERLAVIRNIKSILKDKIFLSLILLNLTMYVSSFAAIDKRLAITNGIRFSLYLFVFYIISYSLKNKKQISMVLNAFIFTAVLSSIVTIFQIVTVATLGDTVDTSHRIASFLENSNNLGAYTILSIFIAIIFMIKSTKKSSKVFFGFTSSLLFLNIIASQSRNALIGLFIGSFLVAILYDKRFIILSAILPIILLIIPQSRLRIFEIFDPTQNVSRFKIWKSAEMMIKDHPISGVGYENFQLNYPIYVSQNKDTLLVWDGFRAIHPHNIFLKIQAELGILGSLFFIVFIIFTIISLISLCNRHTDKHISTILVGITASFIALQFMNLIDNFYGAPKVLVSMFIVLGIFNFYKLDWYNR